MRFSKRLDGLEPYLFTGISRMIAEKRAQGEEVISFAVGDPDLPTPTNLVQRLIETAHEPSNHRYPETEGLLELRVAVAQWYEKRFGVRLDPQNEVISLIGAKEGIGHAALAFLDPGDVALVPDPGYPVYAAGSLFAGADLYPIPLREENGFLPDLEVIPHKILSRARILWLNYPNNPTGAVASVDYFEQVVEFAKKHDLMILHDNCYADVSFDGYRAPSFLQAEGSMDVGMEFHSLSKSYNMTGWRIGMAVGNHEMINALFRVKSNLDSGAPAAIQKMAIEALSGPQDVVASHNRIYQRRRDLLIPVLRQLGLRITPPKASLYIWAKVPDGYTSASFATTILEELSVVVTPGTGYGSAGEGYVRFSLTLDDASLDKAMERFAQWRMPS